MGGQTMKAGESIHHSQNLHHTTKTALVLVVCVALSFSIGWHAKPAGDVEISSSAQPTVYFSPKGGVKQILIDAIRQANEEILVALYYFTDPDLADELVEAHHRGLQIRVILDKSQRNGKYSQARKLADAGLPVAFDSKHRIFHHKFMVIDKTTVVTGSQNWTKSADQYNAENILCLQDGELATQYREQFESFLYFIEKE